MSVGTKHEVKLSYVKRDGVATTQLNGAYNRIKIFFTPKAGPPDGVGGPAVGAACGAGGALVCVERFSWVVA